MFIRSLLLSIMLLVSSHAASDVERSVKGKLQSSVSKYNNLLRKAGTGISLRFNKAQYNYGKSQIKVTTTWHTKAGNKKETVVLRRDEFNEYKGNFAASRSGKVGHELTAQGGNAIKTDSKTTRALQKAVRKYTDMYKKYKVGLYYNYALYNNAKNKIKLVLKWQTKQGSYLETIIMRKTGSGKFSGYFKASKKNQALGKKGSPISINL